MLRPLLVFFALYHSEAALNADSEAGKAFVSRLLDQSGQDSSFLANYQLKFQGCHHVQQWNDQADEEDEVRIKTKRLARFRLCPSDQCNSDKSTGCTSKYGDYVVDLSTFVESYLGMVEQGSICESANSACSSSCAGDSTCMKTCYSNYGLSICYNLQNGDNNFNVGEYTECTQLNIDGNNNGQAYYVGPYCADQGGEIRMGLFTDETCTTFASSSSSSSSSSSDPFYSAYGYTLPYSDTSLVGTRCFSCSYSNNGNYQASEQCANIYSYSGKCETRMDVDYPNESSCSYIEGIKIIREDGVIRTSTTRKSKSAAVAIGFFMTLAVLLAGYVYYLRTKLSRAQINLAAAAHPLT